MGNVKALKEQKTHYRKAFDSPYLSSADIVEPTQLVISCVRLEPDKSKKTKDKFNTAYFQQKEIRPGEPLKPMILNATNSKAMKALTDSPFIDDWCNVPVTVYVDHNVKFGRETVEGLRIAEGETTISAEEKARIENRMKGIDGIDVDAFMRYLKVDDLSQLAAKDYQKAMRALDRKEQMAGREAE